MQCSTRLAALLLGIAPLCTAQAQDIQGQGILQRVDINRDGAVSRSEMTAARQRLWYRLDVNGDGLFDRDEIESARQAVEARAGTVEARLGLRRLDSNNDGKVSEQEFVGSMPMFDLADRNSDGKLSADEVASVRKLAGQPAN